MACPSTSLAHVAVRLRNVRTLNKGRLGLAVVMAALLPVARGVDALVILAIVTALFWVLIAYEATRFAEARTEVRHGDSAEPASP